MPYQRPDVPAMPDLPIEAGEDHENYIADLLDAKTDSDVEALVLEVLDPQLEITPADRAVLWDARVIDRVLAALGRMAVELSQPRAPVPKGIRAGDMRLLRGRIANERRPMQKVVKQMSEARNRAQERQNVRAHKLTGRVHHQTLAAARAMVREGKSDEQILMSLRDRLGIPRDDEPAEVQS